MEGNEKSGVKKLAIASVITALSFIAVMKLGNVSLEEFRYARLDYLLVALLLHTLFWLFWTVRLEVISSTLGYTPPLREVFLGVLASNFVAAITPSSAGGEPVRAKVLVDCGMGVGEATASIMVERFLDAIFFSFFLLVMLSLSGFAVGLGLKIGVVFTALLVLLMVFLYELFKYPRRVERFLKFIEKRVRKEFFVRIEKEIWLFRDSIRTFLKDRSKAVALLVLTALIWISEFLVPSVVLLAFSCDPHWILSLTSQAILVIASLAPLTPGASGIAEFGFFYLYSQFVECSVGAVVGVWRSITYVSNILAGIVANLYYFRKLVLK
ncbi:flippase-like domain-containing protein [Geoglobus sp.]